MALNIGEVRELLTRGELGGLTALSDAMVDDLVCVRDVADGLPVGQVAELLGVSAHTLRYYERAGLVSVRRDAANRRVYDKDSVGRVVLISRLWLAGKPIADIADYLKLVKSAASMPERVELLRAHRYRIGTQLDALQFALTVIDYKLAGYERQEHHEHQ